MIDPQLTPAIVIISILIATIAGLVVLAWGRRLPRRGDWIAASGILLMMASLGISGNDVVREGMKALVWKRGWIWPHDDQGAITAGLLQDGLGLSLAVLAALVALLALLQPASPEEGARVERTNSAIALSAAGVCLSWLSLTPWLAFVGIALTIFGGFIALSAHWDAEEEARQAIRFAWERTGGLCLAMLGACGLAGGRAPLLLGGDASAWAPVATEADTVGAALLVFGLLLQLQPFPFTGGLVSPSRAAAWPKALVVQIFPAFAAFALLIRLEPHLMGLAVAPALGWFMLVSSLLAGIVAFFQSEWKTGFAAWVSSGFALTSAALLLGGPRASLGMLIGLGLGALAVAAAERSRTLGARIASIAGMSAATGAIGFVSAGSLVHWMADAWSQPLLASALLLIYFLYVVTGWRHLWSLFRRPAPPGAHWAGSVVPWLLAALPLGVLWTGAVSGDSLPGSMDAVFASPFDLFFGTTGAAASSDAFVVVSSIVWAALVLGAAAGYWASLRDTSRPLARFGQFVAAGYRIDQAARRAIAGMTWMADRTQWLLDLQLWRRWIPLGASVSVQRTAGLIARADRAALRASRRALSRWIDVPARFLQLIQSGDVQWYLFFGVASGLAILVHFMKF